MHIIIVDRFNKCLFPTIFVKYLPTQLKLTIRNYIAYVDCILYGGKRPSDIPKNLILFRF